MSKKKTVIIGASAAGLRCAARLSRLKPDWDICVVEKNHEYSFAACGFPFALSGDIEEFDTLRKTGDGVLRDAKYFSDVKGIKVINDTTAKKIDPDKKTLLLEKNNVESTIDWDNLVIATGATPKKLANIPIHPLVKTFHTIDDLKVFHDALVKGKIERVAIIGAGLTGCELAESFTAMWGAEVDLIEAAPAPLPLMLDEETGLIAASALSDEDITLHMSQKVLYITKTNGQIKIHTEKETIEADAAVTALGVIPATDFAKSAGIKTGSYGGIAVNEHLQTSIPGIWAAGDCIENIHAVTKKPFFVPLGSIANRQGRLAADNIAGADLSMPPLAGASIIKIFDWHFGSSGLTKKTALASGFEAQCMSTAPHDCADYWPEAADMTIHLVYDKNTRQVLGIQAAGTGNVDKRIDIATSLISKEATLSDFAQIEHAYSPPFAPAMEPLTVAAMAAQNQLDYNIESISPLSNLTDLNFVDVRHTEESEEIPLPFKNVKNIPLEDIRREYKNFTGDNLTIICERGTRSACAVWYLQSKGISCRYLAGGVKWLKLAKII